MKYTVKEVKIDGKKMYSVINELWDMNERWIFDCYILSIEGTEKLDLVSSFLNFLTESYPSAHIGRGSIIDSARKCFTGMSTIEIHFENKDEADSYCNLLNEKM